VKKQFRMKSAFIIVLMFMMVITACSSKNESSPGSSSSEPSTPAATQDAPAGERTLTLMVRSYPNEVEKRQWERVAQAFEEKHEGIKVVFETGDVAVESGKLTTMLASGVTPPDAILMYAGPARVEVLSRAGLIRPLDELYEKHGWKDAIMPFVYDVITLKDTVFEVPHSVDYLGIAYNKNIFAEVGADLPTTAEEFYDTAEKIKQAGYYPIALGVRGGYASSWLFGNIMSAVAGTPNVEKLMFGEMAWTDEPFVRAAKTLKEWVDKGIIDNSAVSLTSDDQTALFMQQKAAMMTGSAYTINELIKNDLLEDVVIQPLPSFTEGVESLATGGVALTWVVPTHAENVDLVEEWFNFILTDFPAINFADFDSNQIPATNVALELTSVNPVMTQLVEKLKAGVGYNPTVYIGNNTKDVYLQALQGLIGGLISPEEAMALAEEGRQQDIAEGFKLK